MEVIYIKKMLALLMTIVMSLTTLGSAILAVAEDDIAANSLSSESMSDEDCILSLGTYSSAAITEDGNLYTWGYNSCGQLGNGKTTRSSMPIK